MGSRLDLHKILVNLLGSTQVYFQPPSSVKMLYPCIVYSKKSGKPSYADDSLYAYKKCYSVTVIDSNPDSLIPDKLLLLPTCSFERHFTAENLNHDIYNLYY